MILIVDMNCRKDSLGYDEFVLPIASIIKDFEEAVVKHYSDVSHEEARDYSRIVLSGTALKDEGYLSKIADFEWIRQSDKPILGICAGMQTIGLVFGSSLQNCLEIGMTSIRTTKENSLFSSAFKAYELHKYSIKPSLELDVLAESNNCVQAIKHRERNIYGVLFHPEVRNRRIIEQFIFLSEH
jgi:GMP synthase-like glutamine amidotransferase